MKKIEFKIFVPHIVAILAFLLLSIVFTKPALEGKVVQQHDVQQVKAMQQQSFEFQKKYGHFPYWTNSMFGGMPAYQIMMAPKNVSTFYSVGLVDNILTLGLPKPVYFLFITCVCFYFLCIVIGVNPWLSILGGIAYGYCSYNPILISAGHDTKLLSMAYAPAVIGSMFLIFKKNYWLGASLLLISSTCLIRQSHQQIVYYTLIMAAIAALFSLIKIIKEKNYTHLAASIGICIAMPVIALLINAFIYFSAYDFTKESMRGGSALTNTKNGNKSKGGLDRDYAFSWSYGVGETLTFIVPNAYGGGSATSMPEESKVLELLQENQSLPQQMTQQLYQAASAYWGSKPSTSGPVYFGAIVCLLALFALFFGKSQHKWWLLSIIVIGTVLAWGKNFSSINYFLFDHLPFYNKFRTPEMAMVIPQLAVALLSVLFVNELISVTEKDKLNKLLKNCLIATGGVIAFLIGFYFIADFKNEATLELKKNLADAMQNANPEFVNNYINAIVKDRQALYSADMWRSIGFILAGIAAIFLYCKQIIKAPVLFAALILFTTIDLVSVDKRYLNDENFIEPVDYEQAYADYNADIQIKRDPGFFRVLNLAFRDGGGNFQTSIGNAFNDAIASYKHNNIGGYHPAKLGVFEDLKEKQIYKNIEAWGANPNAKDSFRVLNMLNMKYVIMPDQNNPKQTVAIQNPYALGNCWLVKEIKFVKTADEEMAALDNFDPSTTAIVNEQFKNAIPFSPVYDSSASIRLVENKNDDITYDFNSASNQFAVFSEMYYSRGWDAYIDGKKTEYCKVNYALRGLAIPAGKHTIKFSFNPEVVNLGEKLSNYFGWFSILFVLLSAFMIWKKNNNKKVA
ncbi:YfhO family protein [Ferruginibacter lapsinanis]|uniref:YfhO family protein n=1 Tax=Ferruginibacter lapsinanis TaxID=563172 RepID=UPI001E2F0416|nr:YfhO family protein [Ferruginibacter lapsinanis]UEG49057.1 YfhO family protein [Ferruginibacter lapsinanis]